jgi:hypothetical protein
MLLTAVSASEAIMPLKLGVKGGITSSTATGDAAAGADNRNGIVVGVFARLQLARGWSLQPELLYVQKGATGRFWNDIQTAETTLKANYIEIPVLLKYNLPVKGPASPSVFAGPALAFVQSSTTEFSATIFDFPVSADVENYKERSTDLGLVVGAGLDLTLSRTVLFFDFRYTLGLQPMWQDVAVVNAPEDEVPYFDGTTGVADDMKNSSFAFTVGLMI